MLGSAGRFVVSRNINTVTHITRKNFAAQAPWEVNTNVAKDVVLYSYENSRFHKYLNIFAITQFGFWVYLAEFSMNTLKDAPVKVEETAIAGEKLPWYRKINMGENKFRRGITTMCIAVGQYIIV